ncbi:MAG TPA: tRNA (adenosine(37)-N6)-threonylcarbamoyltransferase complex dimerization subunit type 1 TsaB [Acidimicrobiia bacterium]|nr:tRNA (adenosine(37)-N6)-threonylcarbamoyltransferase complex dimerization subunit type 1 TsaB [Acidimicrobiia bacterium]
MRIVAIETATAASAVALVDETGVAAAARRVDARGHVAFLVPALDFCFTQARWEPGEIDAVVVDVGPGLFSGIRAGLATAQALAGTAGVPLFPVISLDALALRAATSHRRIWSVVDVRRGEVAAGPYRPVPGGVVRDGANELFTAAALRAMLESVAMETLVVGDWEVLPEGTLAGVSGVKTGRPRYPEASALADIARGRLEKGEAPHPDEVRPRYMREPDVNINWSDFRQEGPWP